jgi:hypothetical protein
MRDYFSVATRAVGGKWLLLPGAISGLIGLYGFVQGQVSWLPKLSLLALLPIASLPLIAWIVGGLLKRAVDLEAKLAPRIGISLAEPGGIYSFPIVDLSHSSWAQIVVSPLSDVALIDCEVHVTGLLKLNDDGMKTKLLEEDSRCAWSDEAPSVRTLAIPPKVKKRANLFSKNEKNPYELQMHITPQKVLLQTVTYTPGKYLVEIVVSARDTVSVSKSFVFTWGNSFDEICLAEK